MHADIYFNLHKRVWSVRDRSTGRVADHAGIVYAPGESTFVVRKAGREKVLREKRKNVHAFCRCDASYRADASPRRVELARAKAADRGMVRISYNPYKGDSFYRCDTGAPVHKAGPVIMIAEPGKPPEVWGRIA